VERGMTKNLTKLYYGVLRIVDNIWIFYDILDLFIGFKAQFSVYYMK